MTNEEDWTIGRLLNWTTDYFDRHGSESARLDAEVWLAEAQGCERIELYTTFEEIASEQTRVTFRELVRRRAEGMPVAYLVGRREFYSLSFHVTPDVLIPRPETEFIVVAMLDLVKQRSTEAPIRVADIGTGSGVLAICAAKYVPNCRVTAVDKDAAALEIARRNAEFHQVSDQIELVQSDLLESVPVHDRFDYILSNPPYVGQQEFDNLASEVRLNEPRSALLAGDRGTEVIARLIPQAAERLVPGGILLLEISPFIEDDVKQLFDESADWHLEEIIKDFSSLPRVAHVRRQ
ncbi:MAG: peptide chain release factor N(5)-glutamine methyltransferase [Planctomycetales bacterium]